MFNSPLKNGLVLVEHVACERCRYDLFGLPLDGVCSECGHDITASRAFRRVETAKCEAARARRPSARTVVTGAIATVVAAMAIGYFWVFWETSFTSAWIAEAVIVVAGFVCKVWLASREVSAVRAWKTGGVGLDRTPPPQDARQASSARQAFSEKAKPVVAKNPEDGGVVKPRR